jgi:hypothetical protein
MAYGQKYQLQFTDLDGNIIKVIISQDGYSGVLMNFVGSDNPIITKLDKSGDDRFEPLKPTSMEIGIFVDTAGWIVGQDSSNFEEFYEIDNFEYRVDKYLNTVLDWSGYINDEVFTEPYQQGKYIVHLTATDGMSILKGRYTELTGRVSHMEMIQECVNAIGLGLNIVDAIGITEVGHTTGGPLIQTLFDTNVFTDEKKRWTLEKVLRDVLRTYGACLSQVHGKWVVSNVESFYAGISGSEYTDDSTYVDSYTGDGEKHIESTLGASIVTLLTGGSIQKNKGWKELRVKRNFGKTAGMTSFYNGDFSLSEKWQPETQIYTIVSGWTSPGVGTSFMQTHDWIREHPETSNYLFIPNNGLESGETIVTSTISKAFSINEDHENHYIFSAKYALLQNGDYSELLGIVTQKWYTKIQIICVDLTGFTWYLEYQPPLTLAYWSLDPTIISIGDSEEASEKIGQQNKDNFKWNDLTIKIANFPGGRLQVKVYNVNKPVALSFVGTAWDNIQFSCEAGSQTGGNGFLVGTPTDNKFTEIPEEVEFTQNDILTENAEFFYNNYLSLPSGEPTAAWTSQNHSGTLADIYLLSVLEAHGRSVRVKNIPGRGLVSPHTRLIDHNGRKYQIISYSHNDKTNQFSCEAVEIIQPGTIPITSNIVIEGSSSGATTSETTEPTEGTGKSDDRLVSGLGTNGFETGVPGRLHGNYFDQDWILSKPVYIPKRLSTLKSGRATYNKGNHWIDFETAFEGPYILILPFGSNGSASINAFVLDDITYLNKALIKVTVDNCTVRWIAYVIDNT